jgi:EAL domain-containing protein (putative c-di-GMP-specific phosphodiesterase class I)/GGDEF domain-containing protein
MGKLRIYGALSRGPLGYRGKIVACAALGAAFPFIALTAGGLNAAAAAAALGGTLLALVLVAGLLAPVGLVGRALKAAASGTSEVELPSGHPDEAGRMMTDLTLVRARLEGMRQRLTQRHPLSGLPDREALFSAIRDAREDPHAVVLGVVRFADYDRMAAFDQPAADEALKAFSERLAQALAPGRVLAHVERDCFAIWFRGVADPQVAARELAALGQVLGQEMGHGERRITPDVGLGAAIYPGDAAEASTLLSRALTTLPRDGRSSGGRVSFFSAESSESARQRFQLEQELRHAISRQQMVLHFQPVVDLAAGQVVGAEALVRWNHPERGLVPPGLFIPVLEQSGLIDEVGLWVLTAACRQARAWEEAGLGGLRMAVNLSARQFRDPALHALIMRTLEQQGLAPHSLELELTETATMEDAGRTRQMFGDLRDLGVGVAIDDFGTGYSSLSYLKNLPFTKLKIDREFVTKLNERRDSQAICTALVELARGLDITVVAEGVETREELDALRKLGCSTFQGFFFAKPLAADDFVRTVTDPEWQALLVSPVHRELASLSRRVTG